MPLNRDRYLRSDNNLLSTIFAGSFILGLLTLILFISYYASANSYTDTWDTSKLDYVSIYTDSHTSCSKDSNGHTTCTTNNYYYINEHFTKYVNGKETNDGCSVRRLTTYYTYSAAVNKMATEKLGTFRKIYTYPTTQIFGSCADDGILKYYNTVAYVMLAFFISSFFVCIFTMLSVLMTTWIDSLKEKGVEYNTFTHKTNLSFTYCCSCWNNFWALADTDGNGTISFSEFCTAMWYAFYGLWVSFSRVIRIVFKRISKVVCCKNDDNDIQRDFQVNNV